MMRQEKGLQERMGSESRGRMEAEYEEETHSHGARGGRDNRSSHQVQANFVRSGVQTRKPSSRWVTYLLISIPVPAPTAELQGSAQRVPREGAPSSAPRAHSGDVPARLCSRPRSSPPAPTPGPALRDVLVEVGEEQLAGAGLAALTRQVHGGRAAGG